MNDDLRLVLQTIMKHWFFCKDIIEQDVIAETLFEVANVFHSECEGGYVFNYHAGSTPYDRISAQIRLTYDEENGWGLEAHI